MDVIASTAFGIQIDSHNDPKNEFVTNATKLFKFKLNGPMLLFSKLLCQIGRLVQGYSAIIVIVN